MSKVMNEEDKTVVQHVDEARKGSLAETEYVTGTAEEKRLVRKIDRHLLPMLWVMYILNYLDRTNIGVSPAIPDLVGANLGRMPKPEACRRISS